MKKRPEQWQPGNRNSGVCVALLSLFTVLVAIPSIAGEAAHSAVQNTIATIIEGDTPRLHRIFKDIHANPELGFMETRTAAIIAKELQALGFEVKTGIGRTGVVGTLVNGEGPVLMYRADIDANAVEEATGLPYASKVRVELADGGDVPVAHMCGHDAHTTWLLSLAKTMSDLRESWSGTLVLVAQPAEEPMEGASAMVEDGLFTRHQVLKPDYFVAMHTLPMPTGTVIAAPGALTSGSEHIDVTFRGVGGHGSAPQLSNDPVVMAAMAIVQYQTIVSRMIDPQSPAVLTIGSVQAGSDNNVIPTTALLKAKLHYFDMEVHERMVKAMTDINDGIATVYGVPEQDLPFMERKGFTSPLVNSPALIARINETLANSDMVDGDKVIKEYRIMGSEDAHLLVEGLDSVEVAYLAIGTAEPRLFEAARREGKPVPFFPHNPDYQVDLDAIPYGAQVAALIVSDLLRPK